LRSQSTELPPTWAIRARAPLFGTPSPRSYVISAFSEMLEGDLRQAEAVAEHSDAAAHLGSGRWHAARPYRAPAPGARRALDGARRGC
jgi:hypothetical protein